MKKVMVMCTGNSFRSHIMEAYLRKYGGDRVEVFSSGVKASGKIYPWAVTLMEEVGIDISNQKSEQVDHYLTTYFEYVITVCDNAKESCPDFSNPAGELIHHSFDDYTPQGERSDDEYLASLRPIRNAIDRYAQTFCKDKL